MYSLKPICMYSRIKLWCKVSSFILYVERLTDLDDAPLETIDPDPRPDGVSLAPAGGLLEVVILITLVASFLSWHASLILKRNFYVTGQSYCYSLGMVKMEAFDDPHFMHQAVRVGHSDHTGTHLKNQPSQESGDRCSGS